MKFIYAVLVAGCCFFAAAAKEFSGSSLILKGGAALERNVITLDGKTGYVELSGTEDWNIDRQGLSLACAVKFKSAARELNSPAGFDMVFSKGGVPFIVGRYGQNGFYTNIKDRQTNKYNGSMFVRNYPEAGTWLHLAATFEHYDNRGQGDIGYITTLYINGTRVSRMKHQGIEPATTKLPLEIGRGWGSVWMMDGQIGEIRAEKRVWSENEIAEMADHSKLVKMNSAEKINPALQKYQAVSPAGKWMLKSLHRLSPERGSRIAAELVSALAAPDDQTFIKSVKGDREGVRLVVKPEILVLFDLRNGEGEPLLGMYDRISRKAVLENRMFSWQLSGITKGQKIDTGSSEQHYRTEVRAADRFSAVWEIKQPVQAAVTVNYTIGDNRISADLKVENRTPDFLLKNVVFPSVRTPRLGQDDAMFYPYQCGALIPDPTRNSFKYGQFGRYPGNSMTMQFSAYYGDGRGVFLGWQDPDGTIKDYQAAGKRGGIELAWNQNAAIPLDKIRGGNHYASPGRVVFQVFPGGWFEACMIHKEWAVRCPAWKIPGLPKKATPEWFRNVPVCISLLLPREDLAKTAYSQLMYLRKYLEVPILSANYGWNDPAFGSWPVFRPRPYIRKLFSDMRRAQCYADTYIDSLLWDTMDGPDRKSDVRWSSHGKKFAVKLENGRIPMENYANKTQYGVMCPNAGGWKKELLDLTLSVAEFSPAIYHDEVMTVQGYCCFDPHHGHALNDPKAWLTQGYRPLYRKIREKTPGVPHQSEEVSEPWIDLFDGGHVWRWTFNGQIPAFQAVYGGRIQYTSLNYDSHSHGDYASNFVKMGNSLVNGIKLGRFYPGELGKADMKRLFLKKMAHLRMALNDYFNNGDMLPPIVFAEPPEMMTTQWGTSLPQTEAVTLPKIVSNSYRLNGCDIFIFVNTSNDAQRCVPRIPADHLCLEGAAGPTPFRGVIELPAYHSAVAVRGPASEAERLQKTLKRIAGFDAGLPLDKVIKFQAHRTIRPEPGVWNGPAAVSGYYNCSKYGSGDYFGNLSQGSMISYGTVDFGSREVRKIILRAAVSDALAGGRIELLTGPNQDPAQEVIAELVMPPTGSFSQFKDIEMKINRPLTGKCNLVFRFGKVGCCNFAGWKIP
jgi:hypothetical protein